MEKRNDKNKRPGKKKEIQWEEKVFGFIGQLDNSMLNSWFQFSPIKKDYQILQQVMDGWFAL